MLLTDYLNTVEERLRRLEMAQPVILTTVDTASTDGNCTYPAAALGGQPIVSPNITIGGQQVQFIHLRHLCYCRGCKSQPTHSCPANQG